MNVQSWSEIDEEKLWNAYNVIPLIAECDGIGDVTLEVHRGWGANNLAAEMMVTSMWNGTSYVAEFDVSSIVRGMLDTQSIANLSAFSVKFSVKVDSEEDGEQVFDLVAANAVSQDGWISRKWTDSQKLTRGRTMFSGDGFRGIVSIITDEAGREGQIYPYIIYDADSLAELARLVPGAASDLHIEYVSCPATMIYWLNDIGGIESYAFRGNRYSNGTADTTDVREAWYKPKPDGQGERIIQRMPLRLETSDTLKLGVENVSGEDYELLSGLPYSPLIVMAEVGQGIVLGSERRLIVKGWKGTRNLNGTGANLEFEFELPKRRLQI